MIVLSKRFVGQNETLSKAVQRELQRAQCAIENGVEEFNSFSYRNKICEVNSCDSKCIGMSYPDNRCYLASTFSYPFMEAKDKNETQELLKEYIKFLKSNGKYRP